jgi:pimeloyl-ACP methyl ester carboxylesterase
MDAPPVQYVKTSDGYNIAYGVSGEGEPLIFLPVSFSHLQLNWQYRLFAPSRLPLMEALAARYRLVQFDSRGQGMSQRNVRNDFVMEDYNIDLEAVVDRLELERFVIFGASGTGHWAVRYAVEHPGRVKAIILDATPISMTTQSASYFRDAAEDNWDFFLLSALGPGIPSTESRRFVELMKQISTREDYVMMAKVWTHADIGSFLPLVKTPTLVLHARDYLVLPVEESIKLAAAIPGAQMVLVDGSGLGDAASVMQALEGFLARLSGHPADEAASAGKGVLSGREIEVLRLLAAGKSNAQIADDLVISQNTVIRHVSNIFAKIGVANRAEAASYATRNGLA